MLLSPLDYKVADYFQRPLKSTKESREVVMVMVDDNAVENIKKLETLLEEKKSSGKIKEKAASEYQELLEHFKNDVANFKRTY